MSDSTAGTTRDSLKSRFLTETNRLLVTGVLTAAVFVVFIAAVNWLSPPFVVQITSSDMIDTTFATMITVVVTGTTLVVTIGQLVLTQENGPLGDQQDRMRNSMDVRAEISELTGSPAPTDPAAFLAAVLDATRRRSSALAASVEQTADTDLRTETTAFTAHVTENAESVRERLTDARFGSFDVLSVALRFDYSSKIFRIERLVAEYERSLTEAESERFDDLKAALLLFGPAREHVKTLYFQWALIELSQYILYAAVPAVTVSGIMIAIVDAGTFPGTTLGIDHIVLVVGAAFSVTLIPFLLFVAYILRILTVAKRTLAIEPLILRDSSQPESYNREM